MVVVVGGRNSANTARLAQLCERHRSRAPTTSSRPPSCGRSGSPARARVGVTAGASTPDEEIEATVRALLGLCGG